MVNCLHNMPVAPGKYECWEPESHNYDRPCPYATNDDANWSCGNYEYCMRLGVPEAVNEANDPKGWNVIRDTISYVIDRTADRYVEICIELSESYPEAVRRRINETLKCAREELKQEIERDAGLK